MGTDPGTGGPARGWPRRWLARRTLRGRLIAGLLALLAVACAAVGVVTYVSLHGFLLNQLDQQLVQASNRYQACLGHPPPPDDGDSQPGQPHPDSPYDCAQRQQQQTFSAQVQDGVLRYAYISYGTCTPSPADKAALTSVPAGGPPFTSELCGLGDYRLLAVADPGDSSITYINGLPMTQVSSTLRQVAIVEFLV